MKRQLRTRHPASRVTLLAAALAVLAAHSVAWGATELPEVTEPTGDAKPEAPCPELEGETPALDKFRHEVERSVCVTAWRFEFGRRPGAPGAEAP